MSTNTGPYSSGRKLNWTMIKNALRLSGLTMMRPAATRNHCLFRGNRIVGSFMTMEPGPRKLTTELAIELIKRASEWTPR